MPVLDNKKHEKFAQEVASGTSAAQAYRLHVATKNCSESTAMTTGPFLAKKSHIALRIEELKGRIAEKVEAKFDLTKEKWLEQLKRIADKAEETEDYKASTSALTQIGKAADYYAPTKVEHSGAIGVEVLQQAVQEVFAPK
jgi:hypothetical protein